MLILRAALLSFMLVAASPALADDLAGDLAAVRTAFDDVSTHDDRAIGYLQAGDMDRALLEIDQLRASWAVLQRYFADKRTVPLDGRSTYARLVTDISMRLVTADMMLKSGRPQAAIQSLDAVGREFQELRKTLVQ